ncbi:hypothetical protein TKK_0012670 [Trichogramma kaykai]
MIGTYFPTSLSALGTITTGRSDFETLADIRDSDYTVYASKTSQQRMRRETGREARAYDDIASCLAMLRK